MCSEKNVKNEKTASPLSFLVGFLSIVTIVFTFFLILRNKDVSKKIQIPEVKKIKRKFKERQEKQTSSSLIERQEEILQLLKSQKEVTVEFIMQKIKGFSERTIRRDMAKLEKLGYSKKVGSTKASKYIWVK